MVQLMEHNPTTIKRFGLRKFCSAAFYLMVKLVPAERWHLFPYEIMGRIPGVIRAELARNVGITPVQLAE
ncbi:hypothetical protein DPMN_171681 [Dreissena polymorpha]|uniref:Uncharacterized protein n=1 Tax=Dreissena polymorpha TaxID=45954 RepID=A0A9D4E0T5_DREPO|nr:hypothetical protein DPMN_171681 [Dreissena polymorpha]